MSFFITDFDKCATEGVANLFQQLCVEVTAAVHSFGWSAKACLARVAMDELEFFPHDNAGARFFAFVHLERAIIEAKIVICLGE